MLVKARFVCIWEVIVEVGKSGGNILHQIELGIVKVTELLHVVKWAFKGGRAAAAPTLLRRQRIHLILNIRVQKGLHLHLFTLCLLLFNVLFHIACDLRFHGSLVFHENCKRDLSTSWRCTTKTLQIFISLVLIICRFCLSQITNTILRFFHGYLCLLGKLED